MAIKQLSEVIETDANLVLLDQSEGDIGNWRVMIDGVVIPNTAFDDGVPEGTTVPVTLDDRETPPVEYDSYAESRYIIGVEVPSHDAATEEVLVAGIGSKLSKASANALNFVGDLPTDIGISADNWDIANPFELYLVKVDGSAPYSFTLDRVAFGHIDSTYGTGYKIYGYEPSNTGLRDISLSSNVDISVTNKHKGTIQVTDYDVVANQLLTFDRNTRYTVSLDGGSRIVPVEFRDYNLEDGDTCIIIGVSYKFMQLANNADYQLEQRVANARRQQLTAYRFLGNSSKGRIWLRRFYPDVRLTGPPAESTGTGQSSVNTRRYNFRAERITRVQSGNDHYIQQKVTEPA